LPIQSPSITSQSRDVFAGEGNFGVGGTAPIDTVVLLSIKSIAGEEVLSTTVATDQNGNWTFRTDQIFKKGTYYVSATAQDKRGALSLEVKSNNFTVRDRPLLKIGAFEITQLWFFIGLVLILLIGFASGYVYNRLQSKQRDRKIIIAVRDVNTFFDLIKKDVDAISEIYKGGQALDETQSSEASHFLARISENLVKMRRYMTENIEDIK
jgi:hypothetical protein